MLPFASAMIGKSSTGPSFNPASLFTGGETGDYWKFDNVNTDQSTVGGNISTATGLVNGLVLSVGDPANKPTLSQPSGNYAVNFGAGGQRLIKNFGSTVAQPGTIIISLSSTLLVNTRVLLTGSSSTSRWQISIDSSANIIVAVAGVVLDSNRNRPFGNQVMTFEVNGTSSLTRFNGTTTSGSSSLGTQGTDQITLGALWDGTSSINLTDVYSLLFINRILTSTERDNMERFMGAHQGLSW